MSADTTPISPARFAAALKDLSAGMLRLKDLEIRNSIAHLQYSNDQLQPFAQGIETAAAATADGQTSGTAGEPDQDCVDAIAENERVIDRMAERLVLIRAEVEERGMSWTEFQSKEADAGSRDGPATAAPAPATLNGNITESAGAVANASSDPWTDGTFQTGIIRNGEVHMDEQPGQRRGGTLNDDQLRQAMEERLRNLDVEQEDSDGGIHL